MPFQNIFVNMVSSFVCVCPLSRLFSSLVLSTVAAALAFCSCAFAYSSGESYLLVEAISAAVLTAASAFNLKKWMRIYFYAIFLEDTFLLVTAIINIKLFKVRILNCLLSIIWDK